MLITARACSSRRSCCVRSVVLDEFSSALDSKLEEQLFESLRAALAGRTLLLITHRASALALVDRVVELPARLPSTDE